MRIKELHIRNIASIEAADINFEKGLNDAVTGDPASVFLICGDTGAGKSAILDALALALYKNTPRLEGASNKTRNQYVTTDGECINITSIEQYTRLGISEKDECYSEVVFEGNDCLEYRARLTLGMLRTRKNADGVRCLNHRAPIWEAKCGEGDYVRVEAATGQPIRGAIGLDFEQFNRMAMLAQGQFAEFLTGGKEKREAILEKLTNTQLFSSYGEAIRRLYNKAKNAQSKAEQQLETVRCFTLGQTEVDSLKEEQKNCTEEKNRLEAQQSAVASRLGKVREVLAKQADRARAERARAERQAVADSDEYKRLKALVDDWDCSDAARKAVQNLVDARAKHAGAERGLQEAHAEYLALAADIKHREARLEQAGEELKAVEAYLEERQARHELFSNAVAAGVQLSQYKDLWDKINAFDISLEGAKRISPALADATAEKQRLLAAAQKAVGDKQAAVDAQKEVLNQLNPAQINKSINILNARKPALEKLGGDLAALDEEKRQVEARAQEIANDRQALAGLKSAHDEAQTRCQAARTQYDAARSCLTTMQMSVEDVLVELRQRMHNEHTDVCPLCGQRVDAQALGIDFQQILTPLQQEEQKAKADYDALSEAYDKAKGAYEAAGGALEAKEKAQASQKEGISDKWTRLEQAAEKAGFDLSQPLGQQLEAELKHTEAQLGQLVKAQRKAESLQREIDRLTDEKKPLDKALADAQKAFADADKTQWDNAAKIQHIEENRAACMTEIGKLADALAPMLDAAYPEWKYRPEQAGAALKNDADAYAARQQRSEQLRAAMERAQSTLRSVRQTQTEILSAQAGWQAAVEPKEHICSDIVAAWTALFGRQQQLKAELEDSLQAAGSASAQLGPYYAKTGKDEAALLALARQEAQVKTARAFVGNADADLRSSGEAVKAAAEAIVRNLEELGLAREEELPDREELEKKQAELGGQIQELVGKLGAIEQKLGTDSQNREKVDAAGREVDAARLHCEKWKRFDDLFGGTRFRTLVQSYILRPLLNNANIYLSRITDRYTLTCSDDNEQLSILILDRYNKDQVRSVTVLSGGERFMVSLALSLALSSLNRPDLNVNILFIDEGFGTLDEKSLDSVMATLEKLQEIAGSSNRRAGIISHREELNERIPVQICVQKKGEGRSQVRIIGTANEMG